MERFADDLDLAQFRIDRAIEMAIAEMRKGAGNAKGRQYCLDCGDKILARRLAHVPNATRCAPCQDHRERKGNR